VWSPKGTATNLGAVLGSAWSDTEAVRINKVGEIVGFGEYQGQITGFLLTPAAATAASAAFPAVPVSAAAAPELSTWAMLVGGFASLAFAGCRRSRKYRLRIAAA
jgi:hypothetical protein